MSFTMDTLGCGRIGRMNEHGRIGGVARPCGVDRRLRVGISRNASTNRRYFDNAPPSAASSMSAPTWTLSIVCFGRVVRLYSPWCDQAEGTEEAERWRTTSYAKMEPPRT